MLVTSSKIFLCSLSHLEPCLLTHIGVNDGVAIMML